MQTYCVPSYKWLNVHYEKPNTSDFLLVWKPFRNSAFFQGSCIMPYAFPNYLFVIECIHVLKVLQIFRCFVFIFFLLTDLFLLAFLFSVCFAFYASGLWTPFFYFSSSFLISYSLLIHLDNNKKYCLLLPVEYNFKGGVLEHHNYFNVSVKQALLNCE